MKKCLFFLVILSTFISISGAPGEVIVTVINPTSGKYSLNASSTGDAWSWNGSSVYYLTSQFSDSYTGTVTRRYDSPKSSDGYTVMPWGKINFTINSYNQSDIVVLSRSFSIDFRDENWSTSNLSYPSHDTYIEIDQTNLLIRIKISNPGTQYTTVYNSSSFNIWSIWGTTPHTTNFVYPAPSVSISGPSSMSYKQTATFTANPAGGNGSYTYQWYHRQIIGYGSWGSPVGTSQTYQRTMSMSDFELRVVVTSAGQTAEATKAVDYTILVPKKGHIGEIDSSPDIYALHQNYPNPFNPTTQINYNIPEESLVSLKVYNALGEEMAELVNQIQSEGYYSVEFNASNLSNGVYFYRITAGDFKETRKMILTK